MIIIVFPGDLPMIKIIPEEDVTDEMLERMEAEVGDFPFWCTPDPYAEKDNDGEYENPQSICNIDDIGININAVGENYEPYTVTRIFSYIVE